MEAPAVLTKQIGPLPVWAWGAGIGGGLAVGIILRKKGSAGGGGGSVLSTDTSGFDPADLAGGTGSFDLGGTVAGGGSPVGAGQPGAGQVDPQGGSPGTKPGLGATAGPPVGAPPHARPRVGPGPTVGHGTPGVGVRRISATEGHRVAAKPPKVVVKRPAGLPTKRNALQERIKSLNERRRLQAVSAKQLAEARGAQTATRAGTM